MSQPRNNALDGLRGLAALIVAIGHCNLTLTGLKVHGATWHDLATLNGWELWARLFYIPFNQDAMVVLFFMLSGHVLALALRQRGGSPLKMALPWAIRRVCRLFPVGIVAALPFIWLAPQASIDKIIGTMFFWDRSINGVIWSLQVEIFGSLLIFMLWAFGRRWLALLVIAGFMGLTLGHISTSFIVQYMPAFALGFLIATPIPPLQHPIARTIIGVLAVVLLIMIDLFLPRGHLWIGYGQTAAAFVLVYLLAHNPTAPIARLLSSPPVHFLGLTSYPFYLLHPAAVQTVIPWIQGHWPHMPMMARVAELSLASVALALLISWIVHKIIEQPGIRLGQKIGHICGHFTHRLPMTGVTSRA